MSALVTGNSISGSVKLTSTTDNFSQEELILNLVIIDRVSTANNAVGEPLTNVVIGRKRIDISSADLNNPITFDFTANVDIPDDAASCFCPKTPTTFANNATIYSGLQYLLTVR